MNSFLIVVIAFIGYLLAYKVYGKFLGYKLFEIIKKNKMPSHEYKDGVDFIPTKKHIVLGHHFTTISGLGPIVGPAIGIIWGWLPALLWIFFGSIFMGALHDFSLLIISAKNKGRTVGDLTADIINSKTRFAFQIIIQFLLWIVLSIFAMIVAKLFTMYPESIIPVWSQIPIAVILGILIKKKKNDLVYSVIAVALMYLCIYLGMIFPVTLEQILNFILPFQVTLTPEVSVIIWTAILFIYVFIASTLPVDKLLQPRDYINSNQLLIAMALLVVGLGFAHPEITAPAINTAALNNNNIPSMMPLLFITIACGAISGFHSLASSGTTVKQVDKEPDTLPIGYGGMILEGILAVIAIMVIAGGLGLGLEKDGVLLKGADAFNAHYASWASAQGLGAKLEAFIVSSANILSTIGIPIAFGKTLIAVFIISFAGTTLDSAARIQRLSLQELCKNKKGNTIKPFNNRYFSTLIVVIAAASLAFIKSGATGALILWPMFGALNQLLAALGLLLASVYLAKKGKNMLYTFIPMIFMLLVTIWSTILNIIKFLNDKDYTLTTLSILILILTAFLMAGAWPTLSSFFKSDDDIDPGMELDFE